MKILTSLLLTALFFSAELAAELGFSEHEFSGYIGAETRWFQQKPLNNQQLQHWQPSVRFQPEWRYGSEGSLHSFTAIGYWRGDVEDSARTHADVREAYWRYLAESGSWEFLAGVGKVYWGVAESRHLVDVINQSDLLEDIDGEEKLGQPMLNLSWFGDLGTLRFYLLPGFREAQYPGVKGRLRAPVLVDGSAAQYESSAKEQHVDSALRYSTVLGDWDVGVSIFDGTSREGRLQFNGSTLRPYYQQMTQLGLDVQYTYDAWLWKFEGIQRHTKTDDFSASVLGFEYSYYQLFDSNSDLGFLLEYQQDDRDSLASPAVLSAKAWFAGARLALNDTQDSSFLLGVIVDADDKSRAWYWEGATRLGDRLRFELEGRWFTQVAANNLLSSFERDDHVTLGLAWYF